MNLIPPFLHSFKQLVGSLLFVLRDIAHHVGEVRRAEQYEFLDALIVVMRQVVYHLVRAEGMSREDYVFVAAAHGVLDVSFDILVHIVKALVPGADDFVFSCDDVMGLDLSEGVAGLGVDEVDAAAVQRISEIVVERVRAEIAVYSGYCNNHGSAPPPNNAPFRSTPRFVGTLMFFIVSFLSFLFV